MQSPIEPQLTPQAMASSAPLQVVSSVTRMSVSNSSRCPRQDPFSDLDEPGVPPQVIQHSYEEQVGGDDFRPKMRLA